MIEMSHDTTAPPSNVKTYKALGQNKARDVGKQIDITSLPTQYPVTNLDIDVTENCNLGCLYCFKGEMYPRDMPLETMKKAFDWLLKASGSSQSVNCNFMGGEPTMRFQQIKEFAPWARRRGRVVGKRVTFSMTTNLTLFTPEIRSFVDEYGFGVLMSIDGCPEVQDLQRPAKNGQLVSGIVEQWAKSMLKTRQRSQARATLHPDYVGYLEKSVRYIHSLGFREMAISASEYSKWTEKHFQELDGQLARIVTFVFNLMDKGEPFNLTSLKFYINKLIGPRRRGRESDIAVMRQPCGAGKGYLMVDYTGDIWPCHRFDGADEAAGASGQFRLANIFKPGFNNDLQRAFMDFDHLTNHKESCNSCPLNPVCGGYCPAANLSDTGSIYTPHDAFCRWSQLLYQKAESLYEMAAAKGEESLTRLLDSVGGTEEPGDR